MPRICMRNAWLMAGAVVAAPAAYAEPLSFSEAVARAAAESPSTEAGAQAVRAAERAIGPAGQLPDPEVVLGLENVPVEGPDAYRLNRDVMTMQSIGVMQEMPSGAERRARRAIAEAQAQRASAGLNVARLEARLGAAEAWIALHYAEQRIALIDRQVSEAQALAEAARGRLAGGAASADAAIAAEIEVARAEDRRSDLVAALAGARANLRRWLGEAGGEPLAPDAPDFAIDPERLRANLRRHPELAAFNAEDAAAEADLRMARAERLPDWSWELMYQRRDPSFGDMASVQVRIGLPLFQPWRQGPIVEARRADRARVAAERAAAERARGAMLEAQLAQHAAASANLQRARDTRLPLAQRRAEAAAGAFAGGAGSASELIAARREVIAAELDVIELEQQLAALGAQLTLQYGETLP